MVARDAESMSCDAEFARAELETLDGCLCRAKFAEGETQPGLTLQATDTQAGGWFSNLSGELRLDLLGLQTECYRCSPKMHNLRVNVVCSPGECGFANFAGLQR